MSDHTMFGIEFARGPVSNMPDEFVCHCPDCGEAIQQVRVIYCTPEPVTDGIVTDYPNTRGLFLGLPCGCVFLHYEARLVDHG